MLFKQLKYFLAVVDCKNYQEAAVQCCVSQSAISQQLIKLENELGVKLLQKQGRTFKLTASGEYFYRKALLILRDLDDLTHKCQVLGGMHQEKLSLGCVDSFGGSEFAKALSELQQEAPYLVIETSVRSHEELFKALEDYRLDLVLNDQRRTFSQAYCNVVLTKAQILVELSAQDPLSKLQALEVTDLKNLSCILSGANQSVLDEERKFLTENLGESFDFKVATSSKEAELMVQSRLGFRLTDSSQKSSPNGLSLIPLCRDGEMLYRNYCAFLRKSNQNHKIALFLNLLQKQFSL